MNGDLIERAKAIQEGVTDGPWVYDYTDETLNAYKGPAIWLGDGEVERDQLLIAEFRRRDESASGVIARQRAEIQRLQSTRPMVPVVDDLGPERLDAMRDERDELLVRVDELADENDELRRQLPDYEEGL